MSQSVIGVQTRFTTALRGPAKKWIITKNGSIVPKIVLNAPKRHRDICPTLFVRSALFGAFASPDRRRFSTCSNASGTHVLIIFRGTCADCVSR